MQTKSKLIKSQLKLLKIAAKIPNHLQLLRAGQDEVGKLMSRRDVGFEDFDAGGPEACAAISCAQQRPGVILYLHGGGYCAGSLAYAKGFGSVIAELTGVKTVCLNYRLAPEHPYPAALEDALAAYRALLRQYAPEDILLMGESAGGGLCFALAMKLKVLALPQPAGIVAVSPWMDLLMQGSSMDSNAQEDPVLSRELLEGYASHYAGDADRSHWEISPLYGDFSGLPPCLLFAGGDEVLRSEVAAAHGRLLEAGCTSSLRVAAQMWHVYPLYPIFEATQDLALVQLFAAEQLA